VGKKLLGQIAFGIIFILVGAIGTGQFKQLTDGAEFEAFIVGGLEDVFDGVGHA